MYKNLDSKVTPFGGLHIIHKQLKSKGLAQFIDDELGARVKTVGYSYSDTLMTRIYTTFCGGTATEDVNYIRENTLAHLKGFDAPSADTILRADAQLATPSERITAHSGTVCKINVNPKMNRLLIRSANHFGMFSDKQELIYDFDHQFIATEKYDAAYSYKKEKGYFPGVASIGGVPVYIEGRNGNCNVKAGQLATHQRAIEALGKEGVYPKKARMDAGSYIKEVVDYFDGQKILFYIRANQSQCLLQAASQIKDWKPITIGVQEMEVGSMAYLFGNAAHRIVVYRVPNTTGQTNLVTQDIYKYMFIITNDWEMEEKQAIAFYNARGKSEQLFDIQNNDFNWKQMPHSFLDKNTVYLIIMAIAHIIYKWLLTKLSALVDGLTPTARLKKFIFMFVTVVGKITKSARQQTIALATPNKKLISMLNST